jgi:hypothetical protein
MSTTPAQPPAEETFQRFIAKAEPAHSAWTQTLRMGLGRPPHWGGDDQPGRILIELAAGIAVHYIGGIHLLRHPQRTFAAEVFVRSGLEYMANVAFVAGRDTPRPRGTPEQRAACLRVSRTSEVASLVRRSRRA